MGDGTKIEWCDATLNVVTGCDPEPDSPACDNCYAKGVAKWLKGMGSKPYKRGFIPTPHPELLRRPEGWKKPRKVFVCSMGDLFHHHIPFEFIASVFVMMINNSRHTFQVLTKRPYRMRAFFEWLYQDWTRLMEASKIIVPDIAPRGLGVNEELRQIQLFRSGLALDRGKWFPKNIWLGTTTENQPMLEKRVGDLLACPAPIHFLSLEPLLGPVDARGVLEKGIDWVIVGGESGRRARPMHPQWARDIRDQCQEAGTAYFFKQWGEWGPRGYGHDHVIQVHHDGWSGSGADHPGSIQMFRVGKKKAGDLLDGVEHKAFPKVAA